MLLAAAAGASAQDWPQFRGPGGKGIAQDPAPTEWSSSKNLKWTVDLPGPGTSSPIVVGGKVFVTCYSGYGLDVASPGNIQDLKRHLVCVDASSGKILWNSAIAAAQPEERYTRNLGEHGYATHTPVSDGERVYVFFGKSGVLAFDFAGKQLWQADVGRESGRMGWGSASSLVLHKNSVIVTATEESQSIRALDKKTGKELWKAEARIENVYNTPALVTLPGGEAELVLAVPGEVWGLNADTGKLKWYAETGIRGNMNVSAQTDGGVIYAFGGNMGSGVAAIKPGGKGDVTKSHVQWTSRRGPDFGSPIVRDGRMYWASNRGTVTCLDLSSGEVVYEERFESANFPRIYASPVAVGDKFYVTTRNAGTFVFGVQPKFQQIALNQFTGDTTDFNATPAVSNGQLFLRSNRRLYCVSGK
ncbi:MAG: PQQ-binding-like beta-propeller repeat protein [Verrucomicrobiota bacterium]